MKAKHWLLCGVVAMIVTATFTVIACNDDSGESEPEKVATPTASPGAGSVASGTEITLTTATAGAEIYYTTNESKPTSSSNLYRDTNKPTITRNTTLKAIAIIPDMSNSDILTADYTVKATTPTASPATGQVYYGTAITLTTATSWAEIFYTTDGTEPSASSNLYRDTAKPTITRNTTLKAIAIIPDMSNSDILTADYTVKATTPTASPATGQVYYGTAITLTTTTEGASIFYTTDGTEPTASSILYLDNTSHVTIKPIITGNMMTIKAITIGSGMTNSDVLTLEYTGIPAPYSWTRVYAGHYPSININDVCYGDGKFIAVGGTGKIVSSTDGVSWMQGIISDFGISDIYGICYGDGKFVAVGGNGKMAYSHNSIFGNYVFWTAVADSKFFDSEAITDICYGAGKFLAVGSSGLMSYSTDGVTWTAVVDRTGTIAVGSTTFNTRDINGVAYGGGKFVAVGSGGKMAYSTNGISWTAVSDSTFFSTSYISGVCYGAGKFVAVGGNGKMAYSTDGVTWTAVAGITGINPQGGSTFGTSNIRGVCYGAGKFVAVGYRDAIVYSNPQE
ncbi:MAG: chitobiase/beta-hexosaminidase C-terminal domain-containing protein [Spirochaetaceae bacterium]|jgi:hypothetical protein|nr:chitobiase/beta-hexosaminidase C-terminal domain-containing protein [Spirochaetaceae bacterium]